MDSYERHKAGQADPSPDERDAPPTNLMGLANYCEHEYEPAPPGMQRCIWCGLTSARVEALQAVAP